MPPSYPSRGEFEQAYPNVKGTAIGPDDSLLVLVTRKYSDDELEEHERIPSEVTIAGETYQTDVLAVGIPHAMDTSMATTEPADHRRYHNPVPGGVSIGNENIGAGTMGSPLLDHEGVPVVLSNSHVTGRAVTQYHPAEMDRSDADDYTVVGILREASPLEPGTTQTTDSALVRVDPDAIHNEILGIGELADFGRATFGLTYQKAGRTTGITEGDLRGRDAAINVAFGPDTIRFEGCNVFSRMSAAGDSGSLIGYKGDEGFIATDLLFAGSDQTTIGIPMSAVQDYHGPLKPYSEADDDSDGDGDGDGDDADTGGDSDPAVWGQFRYQVAIDPEEDIVDGDTLDIRRLDLGFGLHRHDFRVRLLDVDTAELPPYLNFPGIDIDDIDQEKYADAIAQKRFVREWIREGVENHEGEWPFILDTYKDKKGGFGRYLGHVVRKYDGKSLKWALIDEFGDEIKRDVKKTLL